MALLQGPHREETRRESLPQSDRGEMLEMGGGWMNPTRVPGRPLHVGSVVGVGSRSSHLLHENMQIPFGKYLLAYLGT